MTPKPVRIAKKPDNRHATSTSWKKGQSGNPAGAPKRGQSWKEIIAEIGDMTGPEVAAFSGKLGREFASLPAGVTLKKLTVVRVYGGLLNDPQPGLLNAFMERAEGKVSQPFTISDMSDDDLAKAIEPVLARVGVSISPPATKRMDDNAGQPDGDGGAV